LLELGVEQYRGIREFGAAAAAVQAGNKVRQGARPSLEGTDRVGKPVVQGQRVKKDWKAISNVEGQERIARPTVRNAKGQEKVGTPAARKEHGPLCCTSLGNHCRLLFIA
jgi:hypothetical protein